MSKNKSISNIIRVMLGNFTTIISGVVVGFLLPKALSLSDYGFYKTFTLYTTYAGLLSFGIIDGIVLNYGDKNYDNLDKFQFRSYFRGFTSIMFVISLITLISSIHCSNKDTQFIIFMLGLDIGVNNTLNYFRQISQITQRFKEYSQRTIIQSSVKILLTIGFIIVSNHNIFTGYKLYLILIVLLDYFLAGWYMYTYRDIVFGESYLLKNTSHDIARLIKTGFPLLISNFTMIIIMALDRQFVSLLFSKEDYAIYAFAYNMLSLVTVAISAISTVLYPTLKRTNTKNLKERYGSLISIILMLVFGTLASFFPLCWILEWFLPKYIPSIEIFRIIFPGLAISSAISIIMHNYYKVMNNSFSFFKKSVIILFISAIANFIAYFCFKTMAAISIASILTMLIWYLYAENYFVKNYGYKRYKNLLYLCLVMISFYGITGINHGIIGLIVYLIVYAVISIFFFKEIFIGIKNRTLFD